MASIPVVSGGIGYSSPSYTYGMTSQAINGGYTFDLPLATVAAFTNNALAFSAANSKNAQGFFGGVFGNAQAGVTSAANKAYEFQTLGLDAAKEWQAKAFQVQQYGIKKKYKSGCFITTAVCKAQGLPDDCWQLMKLRKFRDEELLVTEEGEKLVKEYYANAPQIVEAIDALPNAAAVYAYLSCHFIDRALQQISVGNIEGATATYAAMFYYAAEVVGHQFVAVPAKIQQSGVHGVMKPKTVRVKPTKTATVAKRKGG